MKKNISPWIHQLDHDREIKHLQKDLIVDYAIVGGGIAGISTAFFILKNTPKKIALFEASRIAYGATGHNAGQVCSYFEKPFPQLVREFGLEMVIRDKKKIEETWNLIDEMYSMAKLDIPFYRFTGLDGLSTFEQVMDELESFSLRKKTGLTFHKMFISDSVPFLKDLPEEYTDLYDVVSHKTILDMLETQKKEFIAISQEKKGAINSALFCQEVVKFLLSEYSDRFDVFEETKIKKVILRENNVVLDAEKYTVNCEKVILCTNGFENIEILNTSGLDIDTKFHHQVNGVVARMSGYLEAPGGPPAATNYYLSKSDKFANMEDPYFYLTRRPYEYESGKEQNLICIGGPQHGIPDREEYLYEFDYPDEVQVELSQFIQDLRGEEPNKKIEYVFTWHGLMGYTESGVRLIGPEPKNPILLYNLGCNGVGILPSIHGGDKISRMLKGEVFPESIFDPK